MKYIIILLLIILLIYFLFIKIENFETVKNKNAFCLIIKDPNDIWFDFLNKFKSYDVFIAIDNKIDIKKYNYPNIKFIIIDDDESKNNGYSHSSHLIPKTPISWDKGLYYFCEINKNYENVWFCEDDVYIPSEINIQKMDEKYNKDSLVCVAINGNIIKNDDGVIAEHWHISEKYFDLPWYQALVSITRIPKNLLEKISEFSKTNKQLDFLEVIIPTLASENKINIITPIELNEVTCCNKLEADKLDKNNIYHPIKDVNLHKQIRDK
jgi:hypothetical protein